MALRPQYLSLAPVVALGFMGSRQGMTIQQKEVLGDLLRDLTPREVHHGDCVGADAEFHDLAAQIIPTATIVIHPPIIETLRAFKGGHSCREPAEYLLRDQAIVSLCDLLIAAPGTFELVEPSGTWATVNYARNSGKRFLLVFPDGTMTSEYNHC